MMRALLSILVLLACVAGCGKKADPVPRHPLWLRWHFAGGEALARSTNAPTLQKIAALPETTAFGELLQHKFTPALQAVLNPFLRNEADTNLLRQLVESALRQETVFEAYGEKQQLTEWLLAIKVGEKQAKLWQDQWGQLTQGAPGKRKEVDLKHYSGWTLDRPDARFLDFLRLRDWVLVGSGLDRAPLLQIIRRLENQRAPFAELRGLLILEAHTARWPQWTAYPWNQIGEAHLEWSHRNDHLHSRLRLNLLQPLATELTPWHIPTNEVSDPLISFTAVRGLSPWLSRAPLFVSATERLPDQLFVWAQSQIPFQTYFALPARNATNLFEQLIQTLPPFVADRFPGGGQVIWSAERRELVWQGLPIMVPYLRATNDTTGPLLVGGLFPPRPDPLPPPSDLFAQVQQGNLTYYDWEITQERLLQWRQLFQLSQLVLPPSLDRAPMAQRRADQWLQAIAPFLGNTVTVASNLSSTQLVAERKSHLGFTGSELAWIARKIDSPLFPFFGGITNPLPIFPTGQPPAPVPPPPGPN